MKQKITQFFEKLSREKIIESFYQFIRFGIVGLSNTAISMTVYYLCIFMGINYMLSNTIAFVISVINAYYWNNKYVFKKDKREGHQ